MAALLEPRPSTTPQLGLTRVGLTQHRADRPSACTGRPLQPDICVYIYIYIYICVCVCVCVCVFVNPILLRKRDPPRNDPSAHHTELSLLH